MLSLRLTFFYVIIVYIKMKPNGVYSETDELAPLGAKLSTSTWHHYQDAKTMQEVPRYIHQQFTHRGGMSILKGLVSNGKI